MKGLSPANASLGLSAAMLVSGIAGAIALDQSVWTRPAIFDLDPFGAPIASACLGIVTAFAGAAVCRSLYTHHAWAKEAVGLALSRAVIARSSGGRMLLVLQAAAEEVFFRVFLAAWLGVFPAVLLFALVHVRRGKAAIGWVVSAFVFGGTCALLFAITGSIVGPMIAHALINLLNAGMVHQNAEPILQGSILRKSAPDFRESASKLAASEKTYGSQRPTSRIVFGRAKVVTN